jgi:hypothetical protein
MDRARLRAAVENIRSVIQEELESHRGSELEGNYGRGIQLCDEMLETIADTGVVFTRRSLFFAFDRYVRDSMPWTGRLLEVIGEKEESVRSSFER